MNKKVIILSSIVVILIGIIMVAIKGFKVNLKYRAHDVAVFSVNQEFNEKDIKAITDEVFGKKDVIIEKSGMYGEVIAINADEITDEQVENIVKKLNEKYNLKQKLLVSINTEYDISEVEAIAKAALESDSVKVEKMKDSESVAEIECGMITEKKTEELANKLNEKYEDLHLTKNSISALKYASVSEYGRVSLRDMAKQYMNFVMISVVLVLVYFVIRFRKIGVSKVLSNSVISIALGELLYTAILAIVRYPIDKLAIIGAMAIYIGIVTYLNCSYIKLLPESKTKKN